VRDNGHGPGPSGPALALHDVSVRYDRVWAIRHVSLEVAPGEIVALIGANGAGKTTTLRAVAGLTAIASGEILLDGQRIGGLPPDRIAAAGIAMVPEGRHVFPYMSVNDNLLMGAFLRRHRQAIQEDMQRVLTRFPRLGERLRQMAGTLSGGEQQMLAIGRALMARPRVLLLDEPSLGLAPQVVRDIARTILTINREDGVTIVLVEQNAHMALRLSSRAYVLQTGQVALAGRSADLVGNEEVKRLYLGG
jgi:branched-chain amino acid transport system ATP-binding protein